MEVILLKKVENLGTLGVKVHVKAGYGRNFLIPTGRAVPANPENLRQFEERRAELEREAAVQLMAAMERKGQLEGLTVTLARKAGDEGRLFGSVGPGDIAEAVSAAGYPLEKGEVRLPQGGLRMTGEYEVDVRLHAEVDAVIKLEIVPEA